VVNKLSSVEVFEAIQTILGRLTTSAVGFTAHARQRARERQFTSDDVRRVLTRGRVAREAEWDERFGNWKYTINGRDNDGYPLAIVVAIEPEFERITVITGKDVDD